MGEETKIEWAHSTFNIVWGCEKVSPACNHCYAEKMANRYGHDVWGRNAARRVFSAHHWAEPLKWNRKAAGSGKQWRVFCGSMCDVFEDHPIVNQERQKLWPLIQATPQLTWMFLTKRPENMLRFAPWKGDWPQNVWAMTTVEDQARAEERIPELIKVPAVIRGLSMEPLLEKISLRPWLSELQWIITGGESGHKARPSHPLWFRELLDQCQSAQVPFLFKQWGEWSPRPSADFKGKASQIIRLREDGTVVSDAAVDCGGSTDEQLFRLGKHRTGRFLDGREWSEVPLGAPLGIEHLSR